MHRLRCTRLRPRKNPHDQITLIFLKGEARLDLSKRGTGLAVFAADDRAEILRWFRRLDPSLQGQRAVAIIKEGVDPHVIILALKAEREVAVGQLPLELRERPRGLSLR